MTREELKEFLLEKADRYEVPDFLPRDPLSVPHLYTDAMDVEVSAFLAATLAWGNRVSILKSLHNLMERMDHAPGQFVREHEASDLQALRGFVHRTFKAEDAIGFVSALKQLHLRDGSLEASFKRHWSSGKDGPSIRGMLSGFHLDFMSCSGVLPRTKKHVANPAAGSAAKRLNMFLRWMVRPAHRGVDLGRWTSISPRDLCIPLDVHTSNVGRKLGLLQRKPNDWRAVEELTQALREMDPEDPIRLDFALFGLGALEGF